MSYDNLSLDDILTCRFYFEKKYEERMIDAGEGSIEDTSQNFQHIEPIQGSVPIHVEVTAIEYLKHIYKSNEGRSTTLSTRYLQLL